MFMHHSEWLSKAKAVPVGQKRRVDHGCGATTSMDVWNNTDSWSAYCHRCHISGRVLKEFLAVVPDEILERKFCDERDLVSLQKLAVDHPEWYRRTVVLLQSKGMSTALLEAVGVPHGLWYNKVDHRLVLRFQDVDIGRDCTGRNGAKWLNYYRANRKTYVYLQGKNVQDTRLVLTEDVFSAMKVQYSTGLNTMSLLGTNFDSTKVQQCLGHDVIVCTDGDQAGYDCFQTVRQRLEPLGVQVSKKFPPKGLDPKDLNYNELRGLLL